MDTGHPRAVVLGRRPEAGNGRTGTNGARVIRGGSWNNNPNNLRAANRNRNTPTNRNDNIGVRCAKTVDDPAKPRQGVRSRAVPVATARERRPTVHPVRPGPRVSGRAEERPALSGAGPPGHAEPPPRPAGARAAGGRGL
ncbi:MAG: SUMF1/EgtB/PvdO family nonheme iron enzyme [Deltaproteobacteria bacterium]|nr:SUMF1/EgtB/PvdO family nonheme iron enzyme [Deltaproteobacteria bacterium]